MASSVVAPRTTKVEFTLGRTLLWLGIATVFTIVQIQQSLNYGKLLFGFMLDDDLTYYQDGLQRLYFLQQGGIIKLLENFIAIPPHALGGTLFALVGFAVFGVHDWAPSAARGLIVFGLILFIAEYLCRGLSLGWKLLIVALALTWRVVGVTVVEGRPDATLGLLLAIGILLVTESSWLTSSWQKQVITGAFFGAAFVCKPSMSPITLFLLISSLITASLIDIWRDKRMRQNLLSTNVCCLATTLAVMAPYYLVYGRSAIAYFIGVIFGKGSEVWHAGLSLVGHALFYITGTGGDWLIGYHWLGAWILFLFITSMIFWHRHRSNLWRSLQQEFPLALGIMMVLTWLVLSIPKTKSPHFGATVAGLLLLTTVQMVVFFIRRYRNLTLPKYRLGMWLGGLGLLAFAWGQFKWPLLWGDPERWRSAYKVTEQIATDFRNEIPSDAKIFLLSRNYPDIANYHILKRRAGQKYESHQYNSFILNDLATNQQLLAQADYIIVETDADHLLFWPAYPQLPTLLAEIQPRRFRLWREYPDYLSNKGEGEKILIYQRVSK